jgi:hypothetical protein
MGIWAGSAEWEKNNRSRKHITWRSDRRQSTRFVRNTTSTEKCLKPVAHRVSELRVMSQHDQVSCSDALLHIYTSRFLSRIIWVSKRSEYPIANLASLEIHASCVTSLPCYPWQQAEGRWPITLWHVLQSITTSFDLFSRVIFVTSKFSRPNIWFTSVAN